MEKIKNLQYATGKRLDRFARNEPQDYVDERNLQVENKDHSIFDGMHIVSRPGEGSDELSPYVFDKRNVPIWRGEGHFRKAKAGEFSAPQAHPFPTDCELGVGAPPGVTDFFLARDNPEHPLANTKYGQKDWWKAKYPTGFGAINSKAFMISPEQQEAEWAAARLLGARKTKGNRSNNTRRRKNRSNTSNNTRRRKNRSNTSNNTRRRKNRSNNTRRGKNRSNNTRRRKNRSNTRRKTRRKSREQNLVKDN